MSRRRLLAVLLALSAALGACSGLSLPNPERDRQLRRLQARSSYEQGLKHLNEGRVSLGLAALNQAVELDPEEPAFYNALGVARLQIGKPQEAQAAFERALALDKNYAEGHHNLGLALAEQKRYPEAAAAFRRAIAQPLYATPELAYYNLGRLDLYHLKPAFGGRGGLSGRDQAGPQVRARLLRARRGPEPPGTKGGSADRLSSRQGPRARFPLRPRGRRGLEDAGRWGIGRRGSAGLVCPPFSLDVSWRTGIKGCCGFEPRAVSSSAAHDRAGSEGGVGPSTDWVLVESGRAEKRRSCAYKKAPLFVSRAARGLTTQMRRR